MTTSFLEIKALDLPQLELAMLDIWAAEDTFAASISSRADAPSFTFYEGPPTANGRPGIHHVLGRTIKDVFCRYKTLKGYRVERKAGWDTHGLPVEVEVCKELGIHSKEQIEEFGIEPFIKNRLEINVAVADPELARQVRLDLFREHLGDDPRLTGEIGGDVAVWRERAEQSRGYDPEVAEELPASRVFPFTPPSRRFMLVGPHVV